MAKYNAYMICTAPRSGSTLLCKLLAATGVAGNPASWFYGTSLASWLEELEVAPQPGATDRKVLDTIIRTAIQKGSGHNGLFGLRQQGESSPFLCEKLAVLCPDKTTDVARFEAVFGATLFVHLTRPDKVEQAVSYLKAEQTGLWHAAPDGTELERTAPHHEPVYDEEKLRACIAMLNDYDHVWNAWFTCEGITPFRLSYGDLAADPIAALRDVPGALHLDRNAANGVIPGVRKLADDVNHDWAARFRASASVR